LREGDSIKSDKQNFHALLMLKLKRGNAPASGVDREGGGARETGGREKKKYILECLHCGGFRRKGPDQRGNV